MTELEGAARLRMHQCELWREGERVPVESLLAENQWAACRPELAAELIYQEVLLREACGERPQPSEYLVRFPQYSCLLQALFELHAALADEAQADLPFIADDVTTGADTARLAGSDALRPAGSPSEDLPDAGLHAAGLPRSSSCQLPARAENPHDQADLHASNGAQSGQFHAPGAIGRYRVVCPLGSGAFGTVWQGYDPHLDRQVAIKVPHAPQGHAERRLDDFQREMRRAAGLRHPGIVTVYDVVISPDAVYMVSEYVAGVDLARRLVLSRPTFSEAAAWVAQAAEALHAAHEQGLIHRDVKPSNILIDEANHARITDFGLAISVRTEGTPSSWAGTPQYMAPEQIDPVRGTVDRRSDIFSLGLVFYELLTGQLPYKAANWAELLATQEKRVVASPRWVEPRVPRRLERICMKALAWDPQHRYQTAQAFADDLKAWLAWTAAQADGSALGEPALPPDQPKEADGARRTLSSWLPVALAISVALLAWLTAAGMPSLVHHRPRSEAAPPPRNPPVGLVLPCQPDTARLLAADLAAVAQTHGSDTVAWCQQVPYTAIAQLSSRATRLQQAVERAAATQQGGWLPLAAEARVLEGLVAEHGLPEADALIAWRRVLDALAALDLGMPDAGEHWLPLDTVLVVATMRLPTGRVAGLGPGCLALGDEQARRPVLDERTLAAALRLPLVHAQPAAQVASDRSQQRETAAVTLDNTHNPHPFVCLVDGRQAEIAPGKFEVFPAVGPIELVFDPGRPGPVVRKLLAPGTYRVGVRSDVAAWDVFAGSGP